MTLEQRVQLHQLHPAKLATDWGTAVFAGVFLWRRQWLAAMAIGFLPSIAVTLIFLSGRLDEALQRLERSAGSIARRLSAFVNATRFGGLALSWAGCWYHQPWLIPIGVLVIAVGWWLGIRRVSTAWSRRDQSSPLA